MFVIFVLGCSCWFFISYQNDHPNDQSDYVKIHVSFIPFSYKPLIKSNIQGKKCTLMIDTGSSHFLDLHKRVLEEIQDKEFVKITEYTDLQGNRYPVSQYRIAKVSLHQNLRLGGMDTHEENIDFLLKGTNAGRPRSFINKLKIYLGLFFIDGRIGWPSFQQIFSLFDFHNSLIFLAKDKKALQVAGIFVPEDFIRIPFELCKCGPVLSVQTDSGIKKFLLDTGASHSFYRELNLQSTEAIHLSMNIEGLLLDHWEFFPYPISLNLINEIDGVLGVDFFKTYAICFDCKGGYIYIRKSGGGKSVRLRA